MVGELEVRVKMVKEAVRASNGSSNCPQARLILPLKIRCNSFKIISTKVIEAKNRALGKTITGVITITKEIR